MLEHEGYQGAVEYSEVDELLHGRLELSPNLPTYAGTDAKGRT